MHHAVKVKKQEKSSVSGRKKGNLGIFKCMQSILHKKAYCAGEHSLPEPYSTWRKDIYPNPDPYTFLSHLQMEKKPINTL